MTLQLNEEWRIRRSDSRNVVVEHFRLPEETSRWKDQPRVKHWFIEAYCGSLLDALEEFPRVALEPVPLPELMAAIEGLREDCRELAGLKYSQDTPNSLPTLPPGES